MNTLKEIIDTLKQIRTETRTKVSDEVLWDSAVRIFNCKNINNKSETNKEDIRATDKQIKLLKNLNVKFNQDITKNEAKILIDKELKKRR